MKYNPRKHHRRSIRLKNYDYSKTGFYFVTACTNNRRCLFGNVHDKIMILNDAGKIADKCWREIPEHFPNVDLHEYVIMPNHVHGIIEITDGENKIIVGAENIAGANNYSPLHFNSFQQLNSPQPFKSPSKTLGSIIRGFKIGVTEWFHDNTEIKIVWQGNFHDHIIRNEREYHRITQYIKNNPANWKHDKFFLE